MRYRILISLTTLMLAACGADNRPSANGPGDSHNLSVDEMRRAEIQSAAHFENDGWLSTLESQKINELNRKWLFVLRKAFDELPYSPETHFINITRHWLEKLPMPSNIDDRRKLVQLRNSFPKDATVSASVLA